MNEVEPFPLDWTPAQIRRFWNWMGTQPAVQELYFSKLLGDAVLDQTNRHIVLSGPVVDLGAGPGYLTQKLVRRGLQTFAIDTSQNSIAALEKRLANDPHFAGGHVSTIEHVPLADQSAQVVFLLETLEHLDDGALTSILSEAQRILKPGGYVVITTPNEEELSANQMMCPRCGCIFHRMQHLRAWSVESLKARMTQNGFHTVCCAATLFSIYAKWLRPIHRLKYKLDQRKLPHLFYIGQKASSIQKV